MMNMTNEDMNELLMPFGLALMTNDESANGLFEIVDQQHHTIDVRRHDDWECVATYVSLQHMAYALCNYITHLIISNDVNRHVVVNPYIRCKSIEEMKITKDLLAS